MRPLRQRVIDMAARWHYEHDEMRQALKLSAENPDDWSRLVTHDEVWHRTRKQETTTP